MTTYLLTWKPDKWLWGDLQACIAEIKTKGYLKDRWSCGVTKKIHIGDRVFLMRQGKDKPGIIGSGWATSPYYRGAHWDKTSNKKYALYINIQLDVLLDPESEPIFPRSKLKRGILASGPWDTQNSGVTIPGRVASKLEGEWAKFLAQKHIVQHSAKAESLPGEVVGSEGYYEGATKKIWANRYERDAKARSVCIQHYGLNCCVCGFNFEKVFGEIGIGYIHVHHLVPLSEIGQKYKLNPIKDLRPICPNCHAMIHSRRPAYTINELQKLLSG
jgi:5-methylcytosine-specific restriction protein A